MLSATEPLHDQLDFYGPLVDGDERACRNLLHHHCEGAKASVLSLCEALTEAFHKIENAWECSEVKIYRVHIASQIGYRLLLELHALLPGAEENAPTAIGCTPERDPYLLPNCMVELLLRKFGWRTQSLGTNLPLEMLAPAMDDIHPRLCWVSVSYFESTARMREQLSALGEIGRSLGVKVICGGRALSDEVRRGHRGITFLTELRELEGYAACGL